MNRKDMLQRLGFTVPSEYTIRMIVDTDAANEADDQYAIMHHLLTPTFDVRGIIATHFERQPGNDTPGGTMAKSYEEIRKVLSLAEIDDVPVYHGCTVPLVSLDDTPESEAVNFIIEEARKEDDRPLYIAAQGAMTNIGAAINKAPEIARKLTVLWNGGASYPNGGWEFNLMQDIFACRALLASNAAVWQSPNSAYAGFEVSMAELASKVRPCGRIGRYLFENLLSENEIEYRIPLPMTRRGENWSLGDNTTIAMVLESQETGHWLTRKAPTINDDMSYSENPNGKEIKVFTKMDYRMSLEDFFAKLRIVYSDKIFPERIIPYQKRNKQ